MVVDRCGRGDHENEGSWVGLCFENERRESVVWMRVCHITDQDTGHSQSRKYKEIQGA